MSRFYNPCASVSLSTGDRLGPYEILASLGAGGMGEVYRARDTRLGREVAVKVLQRGFSNSDGWARFEREARAASALSHPNICAVFDVGEAEGRPYLVLELIDGVTLRRYIDDQPMEPAAVLAIGRQIADALEAAHAKGIVHRDIKSGNVMIAGRRHVKVLDFGLAKQTAIDEAANLATREQLTLAGAIVGTPHYLAPELLRGAPADARSDVWALGVVLYEMLAGRVPFGGSTPFAIGEAIVQEPLPPLPAGVPAGLRAVVERCLARRPADRYPHAGEVRVALDALQSGQEPATPRVGRAAPARRARWGWAAAAFAVMVTIAIAFWPRQSSPPTPAAGVGPPLSSNQRANEAFALAMQFLAVQNDLQRGNQALERAIQIDPQFAEARRLLATNHVILLLNGYTNDTSLLYRAEEELREIVTIAPTLPSLTASFTAVYLSQGRRELADLTRLDQEIAADPGNAYSRIWRGIARLLADDAVGAKADFRAILDRQPLFGPARMFYGEALRNEGNFPAALHELSTVLEQAPNNISAVWWLMLTYLDNGETPQARALLEQKREIFGDNYFWREAWALLLAAEGQPDAARAAMAEDTLKFAAAAFPATAGVAEFYALVGDTAKALEWIERSVRNGDERTSYFRRSRRLASIHGDSRFKGIIEPVELRRKPVR